MEDSRLELNRQIQVWQDLSVFMNTEGGKAWIKLLNQKREDVFQKLKNAPHDELPGLQKEAMLIDGLIGWIEIKQKKAQRAAESLNQL